MAHPIQRNCPNCSNIIPIPAQYVGRVKCRHCGHIFKTKGQLHEQRKYILEKLADLETSGFQYVRWLAANDEYVCPLCAEKNKRLFKPDEVRQLIQGKFCQAKDFWQGCRCIIGSAKNPTEVLKKPKSKSPVKVVTSVKTEIRNREPTTLVQFDLKVNKRRLAKLKKKSQKE